MTEWRKVKLGDICETQYGYTASAETVDTGTKFLRITDIVPDTIDWDSVPFCKISNEERKKYILRKGDIVVARTGATVGYAKYIKNDVESVFASYLVRFKVIDNLADKEYVGLCVTSKTFKDYILSIANGSAQPNANSQMMSSFEIALPPIDIQHRIAEVLSRYDALIENYQRQIKLLEEAAQRLYKEWFVDLRFPGHQSTPIINNLPQSWQKKKLGEITCKFATGLNPRKNFVLGQGDNYYVTIKNMADNDVIFDDKCDKVDDEALEKINKRSDLQQGDLLFSGIGTIGRVYLIDEPVVNWNISESVFTMRPVKEISPVFLYLMLLNKDIQDYCQSNAHGCAQKGIRMADLKAYETIIPDKETLESFVTIASKFINRSKSLRKQIRNLSEARDRLLPKLMSAEIEV